MKPGLLPVILIYLFTRIPFLRTYPVFYDSFEYAAIAHKIGFDNFPQVIAFSHQPVHTGYLIIALIFKKLFYFLDPTFALSLISPVFGLFTVIIFFRLVAAARDKTTAFFASLLLMFFPYFFTVTTDIFYESVMLFFLVFSFYQLLLYGKDRNRMRLTAAGISLGLSTTVFIGSLILYPVFLLLFASRKPRDFLPITAFYALAILAATLPDYLILGDISFLYTKYASHLRDWTSPSGGLPVFLFRVFRNIFVQYSSVLSLPVFLLFLCAVIKSILQKRVNFLLFSVVFIPSVILSQYWHAGLYGRLILYIVLPVSYFLPYYYRNTRTRLLIAVILFVLTARIMNAHKQSAPIYQYYNLYKNNAGRDGTAVVTSDYNRFLFERDGIPLFILRGNERDNLLSSFIEDNLSAGREVVLDSSAIRYPYFQYDGDFYHPQSRRNIDNSIVKDALRKFQSEVWAEHPANKNIYFLRLTTSSMAIRINEIKSAYDRTYTNSSLWGRNHTHHRPGHHRLADIPNPERNQDDAGKIQHNG